MSPAVTAVAVVVGLVVFVLIVQRLPGGWFTGFLEHLSVVGICFAMAYGLIWSLVHLGVIR